ncbi:DHA2 family efflux MFS transporter permease subunit [Nocardiopsis synnemataformans]|uniref:DHA2 family efflux MFS transporter permease subunit n=1 Tax=Nocardiopsis synnemataformans TaxID=61305 RepID=UPI003EC07806
MSDPDTRTEPPPPIPARTWWIAAVTGAGAFLAMLDSTVANLALESIRADLGSTLGLVQWVATAYLVSLALSLPAAGWLGGRYGYGRLWAASLAAFVVASVLCALAPGLPALIGARVLQGLAAGLMVPAGQAVIGSVAGASQLGRLMGALGVVISLGPAVGPAVGGLLLEAVSWRWLFWINVPVGVAALIAARGLVPAGATSAARPLDLRGLVLLGVGLSLLLYGGTEAGSAGPSALPVVAVVSGAVLAAGFVLTALRGAHPLIDLRLLRRPTFAWATLTTGFTGANMYSGLLLLPLYLQLTQDRDGAQTGLLLLAMGLGSAAALYLGGSLSDRYGAGGVTLAGAAILVLTTLPFLATDTPAAPLLIVVLIARGAGVALAQMPATAAAYASVATAEIGDATTLVNIVQRVGGAVGAAGVVVVLAQAGASSDGDGYAWAFAALTALSFLTLVSAAFLRRAEQAQKAG